MNFFSRSKAVLATVVASSFVLQPLTAWSAIHPVSFMRTDSPTLQTFDFAASTDFDYDATPAVQTNGGVDLNRAFVTAVFAEMAQFMFIMTEGRHRAGTVYVYRSNRFSSNVDMRIMGLAPGRSNAHVAGWQKRARTSTNFVARNATVERTPQALGKVVAHEHGHYLYGLYDEYREAPPAPVEPPAVPRPLNPRSPQSTDTPLDTLMNNQNRFSVFSTPADINDDVQTAQKRAHGGSAWETLARPQSADPASIQNLQRTAFAALSGFLPLNQAALTKPTDGWDAAFKVVYVPDPAVVDVYVIGRKLTAEQLTGVKNSVIESLRQEPLAATTQVSIVTFPGSTVQALTALDTEAKRVAAIAAVEAITPDTASGDITQTLDGVLADLSTRLTANSIKTGDTIGLHVVAGSEDRISVATRDRIRELRLALNASVITADVAQISSTTKKSVATQDLAKSAMRAKATGGSVSLSQLAHATGGHYNDANRISALTAGVTRSKHASAGIAEAPLAANYVSSLAAGAKFDLKTPVLAKTDGKLTFVATWANDADNGKLRYELAGPDGARFSPADPTLKQTFGTPAGEVKYSFDGAANSARFEVSGKYVTRSGVWTSTVTAAQAVSKPIDQTATADSAMLAEIEIVNDGTPNAVIEVNLSSDRSVEGAIVTAAFYGADGKVKLTRTLFDDATNGDEQAGDGTYTLQLAGLLEAGMYDVVATVTNSAANSAVFSTRGSTEQGVDATPELLGGAFSRTVDTLLTMAPTTVVEYYVPAIKKYFITGREGEKTTLGQYPALFKPTGMSFVAGLGSAPPAGTQPICRYHFAPPSLPNTHFYGVPSDCALVATAFSKNPDAKNEGIDFAIATPDAAGNCPASAPVKIYRSFNNRAAQNDGNHRYTVSTARYQQMTAAGWSGEGAVMCAASATDAAQ